MTDIDDDGRVFPANDCAHDNLNCPRGLSFRDYIATAALQGFLSSGGFKRNGEILKKPLEYSEAAYDFADAMIKARGGG